MNFPSSPVRSLPARAAPLLALLLAACVSVGPDYQRPALPTPTAWQAALPPGAAEASLAEWWRNFGDATLTRLEAQAFAANTDLRLARARLRESRARRLLAGAQAYPSVEAAATGSATTRGHAEAATTSRLYTAGFDASWEADLFGATRRATEAAQADLEASAASLDDARVSLAAEVALNYMDYRGYRARLAIAKDNLARQRETLQLVEWREQAGLTTSLEVEQARSNAAQTRATLPTLEDGASQARLRLETLLARPPGTLLPALEADAALPRVPAGFALALPAAALEQRPDLRVAERQLAAATARVGTAEAARYPGLNLSASFGLEAARLGDLGTAASITRGLAGSLAATLFDAGRLRTQVEIQNALQEQALLSYENTARLAIEEVENALVALRTGAARRDALAVAAVSARNAATLARQRYASGITDYQTVLDTERTQLGVEDSLLSSEQSTLAAAIQLYKALGGGWQSAPAGTQ